jgi:hypothetical protein
MKPPLLAAAAVVVLSIGANGRDDRLPANFVGDWCFGEHTADHLAFYRRGRCANPDNVDVRATIAREARQREALATARAENANLSAIDYLLQVLRDPTTPPGRRTEVAKFVAPYLEYRVRVSRSRRGQATSKP